ncbi:MAG: carbohydrate-binding family 9-like protein [Candidatus Limivicinus sp.]|jgi:hypothetical protein
MSEYRVMKIEKPDWGLVPEAELMETGWLAPCGISASAQLCHDGKKLYVRMTAAEKNIRATLTGKLDQVCNDSCLEFFFAPLPGDERYFNFEFNPLGALNLGFGAKRATRVRQIVKNPEQLFAPKAFRTETGWGISYEIPGEFIRRYFPDFEFRGMACANFYKCGDKTEKIHYLSWAPMSCDRPDFHRREDFGNIIFE